MKRTRVRVVHFAGRTRRERRYATTSNEAAAKRDVTVTTSITGAAIAIREQLRFGCLSYVRESKQEDSNLEF